MDGTGAGQVSSDPAGIACPADGDQLYADGVVVTLTASANPGSVFDGWSGDCAGLDECALSLTAARQVTATFRAVTYQLYLPLVSRETP